MILAWGLTSARVELAHDLLVIMVCRRVPTLWW